MDRTSLLICFGLLFSVGGTLLSFSWNYIFDFIVNTEIPVSPTSMSYTLWKKSTITTNFYVFNWTNAEKVSEKNYIPEFVELGPYSFKEVYEKVNLTWNANHTVTYKKIRRWYFDPENSKGNLSDRITTLNTVAVASSFASRFWGFLPTYALSTAMRVLGQKLWTRTTVREMLFDGYDDPILKIAHTAPSLFGMKVREDKVAFFLNRNGSATFDGVFNAETGVEDAKKLGIIRSWNYKTTSDSFEGECSTVTGSAGELFPPVQSKEDLVALFVSDLCRSVKMDFSEETEVRGIPAYRYKINRSVIDNGTTDPLTHCNCAGQCLPAGVLNVSTCLRGIPAFTSYPHFYDADPYYLTQLKGLKPDPNRHRSDMALEPNTGIPVYLYARLQINLLLQANKGIGLFKDVPRLMFPVLWFEQLFSLSPSDVLLLRLLLLMPVVGPYISLGFTFIGLVMMAVSMVPKFLNKDKHKLRHCIERNSSERTAAQVALPISFTKGSTPAERNGVKPQEESSLLTTQPENELMD